MRARAWVALALAVAVPATAWVVARRVADGVAAWVETPPARGPASWPVTFEVAPGEGAASVARTLERKGLVSSARSLRLYVLATRQTGRLQAGEYEVESPASPHDLVARIVEGRVALHPVTVPEGLDLEETVALLAATERWSAEDLRAAFRDTALVRDLDPEAPDLEGYLFPETYALPRSATARELALAMVAEWRRAWTELEGPRLAAEAGRTPRQVATLASLVEEETSVPDERPFVASVYANRLRVGMLLQCDPTVIYGLKREGLWNGGPVLYAHLDHDSPWNTYRRPGLPPGPISGFGRGALSAALSPAESPYLFFVATGDGGHRFAATEIEHRRNVLQYRRAQREERRRETGR